MPTISINIAHGIGVAYIHISAKSTPPICGAQDTANCISTNTTTIPKGAQRAKVISITNAHIGIIATALIAATQVCSADNAAYLAFCIVLVIYRNITSVEDIFQITTVPITGNAADNV